MSKTLVLISLLAVCLAQTYTPFSALYLTRHGARSPYLSVPGIELDEWDCSFSLLQYPGIAPQTQTVNINGPLYRKNYIPNQGALPGKQLSYHYSFSSSLCSLSIDLIFLFYILEVIARKGSSLKLEL